MAARIRKGDKVVVLTGKDKGKSGEVTKVLPAENRVVVSGVNIAVRHKRQTQAQAGGIVRSEAAIHVSNVAHLDPRDGKATRIGFKTDDKGRKVRFAKRSGENIDA
jgi:large subunit ribosomal protein L24